MKNIIRNIFLCLILLIITWMGSADEAALKNPDGSWKWTNQLIRETSPYLLLHAHNPVEWYPWNDEALERAKKENKPIFLSVGYSTCYWCHVMEREVFSNPEIAEQMNKNFVNIKIDREERPDLDEIYMTATQLLIQRGGWPNSVFLTPDLKPFFAGTYFPPTDMPNRPGFPTILMAVHEAWVTREAEVIDSANRITQVIERAISIGFSALTAKSLDRSLISTAVTHLKTNYKHAYGGFSGAPKFPSPANLEFLLREYERQSRLQPPPADYESLLKMVTHTLDMMAYGGIYDQIGGGFHRYSVDAKWLVPHFEKMLYDNAQLAKIYLQAYQLTKKPQYRRIAEEIFSFIFREMTAPEGGFYSALDAETDAEEGKYYVWTDEEIKKAIPQKDVEQFTSVYGVDKGPNFEGKIVLYVPNAVESEDSLKSLIPARDTLLAARSERERPLLDTKIIVNWNGLMIDALAYGYEVLGEEKYLTAASKAAQFILDTLRKPNGELWHTYTAGVAKYDGYLDDYAFFVRGLLGLYSATGEERWLRSATTLTDKMIELFWDEKNGGFYFTKADAKQLIVRTKKPYDSAIPSGNAVAVNNLLMLEPSYRNFAKKTLLSFSQATEQAPSSFMHLLYALNGYLSLGENRDASTLPKLSVGELELKDSTQSLITATAKIKTPTKGDQIDVEVKVKIAEGWHINANPAGQDNLIPTTITVGKDAPVEVVEVKYPKGKSVLFEFSPETLNVYEGTFTIPLKLKQKPNMPINKDIPIKLKLDYQSCNDAECLLPETLDILLKLK
ncbi:MAG: DUF255 domain-containing protein [Candidatus Poribacteria bacterium]|nr:DUF255 domain-containing protein [Candidatus Poribacteria bacterium]